MPTLLSFHKFAFAEIKQTGHVSRSGPEVKDRSKAKKDTKRLSDAGQLRRR